MKHNLTLVILTPEQIARARAANGSRKRITHALVCGPYGQMFGTERQCLKYFTVWDPDHRIEVAPGQFRALYADLFDQAVKTTAYAISDYRTTPDLAARLVEASGTEPPAAPDARGLLGRILARKGRRSASRGDSKDDTTDGEADPENRLAAQWTRTGVRQRGVRGWSGTRPFA
ncbi:MAG: hypothetical protein OXC11_16120, partial [Rhodospirillales bacterium]|nr:hypothetical protein [Rhodospirillales bacterium]